MALKKCRTCGAFKDERLFSGDSSRADGLMLYCKKCHKLQYDVKPIDNINIDYSATLEGRQELKDRIKKEYWAGKWHKEEWCL